MCQEYCVKDVLGIYPDGGGGRIRTFGPVTRTPVFKTGALIHYATPPPYIQTMLYNCIFLLLSEMIKPKTIIITQSY